MPTAKRHPFAHPGDNFSSILVIDVSPPDGLVVEMKAEPMCMRCDDELRGTAQTAEAKSQLVVQLKDQVPRSDSEIRYRDEHELTILCLEVLKTAPY